MIHMDISYKKAKAKQLKTHTKLYQQDRSH